MEDLAIHKEFLAEANQTTEYCRNIIRKKTDMMMLQKEMINRSNRGWFNSCFKDGDA